MKGRLCPHRNPSWTVCPSCLEIESDIRLTPERLGGDVTAQVAAGMLSGRAAVSAAGLNLTIRYDPGMDQLFLAWLKNTVRTSDGDPRIIPDRMVDEEPPEEPQDDTPPDPEGQK